MTKAVIGVKGMTCDGCVNSVTRALKAVPGVQTVSVSLEKEQAQVDFESGKASIDDLRRVVEEAGFDAV
ncbi:MAG: heavy-metal-associated domain-containing protein [Firmicutes bacterium]|nr:heavy-metal-associated domain-containing protein [Bacillota bacterium]